MFGGAARHRRHWLLPVLCGVLLGGCPPTVDRSGEAGRDPLTQRTWVLRHLQGTVVPPHDPEGARLEFAVDHTVAGKVSCNSISSHAITWYEDPPGQQGLFAHDLSRPSIRTAAGCGHDRVIAAGDRFWTLMDTAQRWRIADRILTIQFADGSIARLADAGRVGDDRRHLECPAPNATAGRGSDPGSRNLDCRAR